MTINRSVFATEYESGSAVPVAANALSLRHLLRVATLSRRGNLAHVADELNCSAAAVMKSVNEIEQLLNLKLFTRAAGAWSPTEEGRILSRRSLRAVDYYQQTIEETPQFHGARSALISNKRSGVLLAVFDHGNLNEAAKERGLSTSAVYGAIASLQKTYSEDLFERSPQGELIPTQFCQSLVRAIKLVRSEVRFALEEISNLASGVRGRIAIGVLPRSREYLLPRAINRLVAENSEVNVGLFDATAPSLIEGVRSGELDFIVGALYDKSSDSGLIQERLLTDHIVAIARADHPLATERLPSLSRAVRDFGWVVGMPKGIVRDVYRQVLAANGLKEPEQLIETNSFSLMQGLLLQGDWIGLSSAAEIHNLSDSDRVSTLDFNLSLGRESGAELPISVIRRTGTTLPPAAALALEYLRVTAAEFVTELERSRAVMFRKLRSV